LRLVRLLVGLLFVCVPASALLGADVMLSWDANTEPDLAGYRVYYGTTSTQYAAFVDVGIQTSYTVRNLAPGTYYLALTARSTNGSESPYSNEVSAVAASSTPPDLVTGLVGAYALNEGSGTTATDGSGTGNGGAISGASWNASGKFGSALTFNGSAYVAAGVMSMPAASAPQSFLWWANVASNPTTTQMMIVLSAPSSSSAVAMGFRGSQIAVWMYGGALLASAPPPSPGAWHHYGYTFDGLTHRLYIDGVQAASSTATPQSAVPTNLEFGRWLAGTEFFAGSLDEIRIYTRALNAAEVAATMTAPMGDVTAPVISGVTSSGITSSAATIAWTTNEASDTQIEYGLTTGYGNTTTLAGSLVTTHSQGLGGLLASTLYHYRVKSRDAAGNLAVSGDYMLLTAAGSGTPAPDLSITLAHNGSLSVGSNAQYVITVANSAAAGPTVALVTVTDTLPTGLQFVSYVGSDWNCSASGQVVTCNAIPGFGAGATSSFTLTVSVGSSAGSSVTNIVSVATAGELVTSNNTASDTAAVSSCAYSFTPASAQYAGGGGTGTVAVTVAGGCAWSAVTSASWLHIDSGASGSGTGSVAYTVQNNNGKKQRSGTITLRDAAQQAIGTVSITQSGSRSNLTTALFSLDSTRYLAGDLARVTSFAVASGLDPVILDWRLWIRLPDGTVVSALRMEQIKLAPDQEIEFVGVTPAPFLLVDPSLPSGNWEVGITVTDAVTGEILCGDSTPFSVTGASEIPSGRVGDFIQLGNWLQPKIASVDPQLLVSPRALPESLATAPADLAVALDRGTYREGDLVSMRRLDLGTVEPSTLVDWRLWLRLPDGSELSLLKLDCVEVVDGAPDASWMPLLVLPSGLPAGEWEIGIRMIDSRNGAVLRSGAARFDLLMGSGSLGAEPSLGDLSRAAFAPK